MRYMHVQSGQRGIPSIPSIWRMEATSVQHIGAIAVPLENDTLFQPHRPLHEHQDQANDGPSKVHTTSPIHLQSHRNQMVLFTIIERIYDTSKGFLLSHVDRGKFPLQSLINGRFRSRLLRYNGRHRSELV